MKRQLAEDRGRRAEDMAAIWLQDRGWNILDRRRKTALGEIDLVVRKDNLVAFVEVKWRKKLSDLDLAIDERRLARVANAAGAVGHEYAGPLDDMRIDVLLLAPGTEPRHIANAWQP